MASDKAPAVISSIHTPSSSLALVHSVTTESLTSLFDKLSRKRNTEFYGKCVGPEWLKYEWSGSVWNLDDDGDYAIFQWRQKSSTDPPTIYLKDPLEPLPSESSYRNPSFYQLQAQTLSASVLGKRPRAADEPKLSDLPWLEEIRSKLWNREDRRPQLFRNVKVTQADYAALQELLKELHSDRDTPDYDGTKPDVLSVKLNFLRSLPDDNDASASLQISPVLEASNEDDYELESLFPSILSFLDLSTLKLKERMPRRLPLPLLLRQEYKDISELIKKRPQNSGGSVIVSGQPGTGKTAYLYLRILESMIEARPFLYQTTVAFVDGDKGDYEPNGIFLGSSVQLIVASSPKGAYPKWPKLIGPGSFVTPLVVKLWSYKELLLTGIFLHPFDLSFELLRESTSYFGNNPRRCFEASSSVDNLLVTRKTVESIINDAGPDDIMKLVRKTQTGGSDISHRIFQNFPADVERLLPECHFESVSGWALDLLLDQYKDRQADMIADFYYHISEMPEAATLRGHLFKRQVLNHLRGIRTEYTFPIRWLPDPNCTEYTSPILGSTDSEQTTWTYPGPKPTTLKESTVLGIITKAVQCRTPLHLVPLARNFAAVDSIVYDPNGGLTCIQITSSSHQPIAVSGLQRIQKWLEFGTSLEALRPDRAKPWHFVFIVPSDRAPDFTWQRLKDDTRTDEWAGKVEQYVLGLDEETIFGRRSDSSAQRAITSQHGQQTMDTDDT